MNGLILATAMVYMEWTSLTYKGRPINVKIADNREWVRIDPCPVDTTCRLYEDGTQEKIYHYPGWTDEAKKAMDAQVAVMVDRLLEEE